MVCTSDSNSNSEGEGDGERLGRRLGETGEGEEARVAVGVIRFGSDGLELAFMAEAREGAVDRTG